MHISFEQRPTQEQLFNTIIEAAAGQNPYNTIHSGGAIRGAKSFTNSLALLTLCKIYPNSKWSVHRKDMTVLEITTIETMNKIVQGLPNWKWNRDKSKYHLKYLPTDSRIFFVGANESRDKDFTDTLGLEINGCLFDQLEDVSEAYYNAVRQRLGSWHIPHEPRPLCLTTFNPHPGWIKKGIYTAWKEGKLPENHVYFPLSPFNEPSNTDEQWAIWNAMPPDVRARMIEGDWNSFENKNPYFFAFDKSRHIGRVHRLPGYDIRLSFDFNINPATCTVWQMDPGVFCHCLKSYKIINCTIKQLCDRIRIDFPEAVYRVTGDPAGKARNQGYNSPNETMYSQIRESLNIGRMQVDQPEINYSGPNYHRETRVFANTVLQNHPNFILDIEAAADLIQDIELATTEEGSDKLYKTSGATEYGMHLVDTFIYMLLTYFNNYIKT